MSKQETNERVRRGGFTLIEILIVVAVIGILASVILIGLGPIQRQARDARRLSDLRQVQHGLELYYNRYGQYPPSASWAQLSFDLINAGVGISNVPNDPRAGIDYVYGTNGSSYVLGAGFEDANHPALQSDIDGGVLGIGCDDPAYCVQL